MNSDIKMNTFTEDITNKKVYSTPDQRSWAAQLHDHKIELVEQVDAVKLRYIIDHPDDFQLDEMVHTWGKNTNQDGQVTILQKYLKKVKNGRVKCWYKQNNKQVVSKIT